MLCLYMFLRKRVKVITGRGNPSRFHGTPPFVIETGEVKQTSEKDSYTDVFSKVITDVGKKDEKVVTITAAMADGTG